MTDFGMVGLIATVLSIGFAFAAFINSRRRMSGNQEKPKEGPPGLPFLAPGEQTPGSFRPTQAPYYSTTANRVSGSEQTKPAFIQVQAMGAPSGQKDTSKSDEYLWE